MTWSPGSSSMVYGAWSVAQTKNQLQSPKLRTPVAPSCLRLSHLMRTSWSAGRPRLSEPLVPSRLPCLRKSRFLSGTVRMTLFSSGRPSRCHSFSSARCHTLMCIMPYSLLKNQTQSCSTRSLTGWMNISGSLNHFLPLPSASTTSIMSWLSWPSLECSHTPLIIL